LIQHPFRCTIVAPPAASKGHPLLDLDEALERFHVTQPEYLGGLSSHGPMAAEALVALGHSALVQGFVDVYAPRLRPLERGRPLAPDEEPAALGCYARFADWLATLEGELLASGSDWADVVARRVPAWIDGLFAAATHGLLRTAHAVRALRATDTRERRRELAHGLAYWAARHAVLPGTPGAEPRPGHTPEAVLRALEPVPQTHRRPGLFTHAVAPLESHDPFLSDLAHLDVTGDFDALLGDLAVAAADLYLANPAQRIAYVHALTGPSALRLLAPALDATTRTRALARATQAAAALHAVSATDGSGGKAADPTERDSLAESRDEIRYRAACSLNDHAIKYAEACLREDALRPHASLRRAAADAALALGGESLAC